MNLFYSFTLHFYNLLILIASLFNRKAALWIKGRKKWQYELKEKIKQSEKWIWFHCSSLGEFEDSCEIFLKIQKRNPTKKTILTVYSPTAFEVLHKSNLFDHISYLPLDTLPNAKTFLDIVQPELVLFSRSELWFNFLKQTKARKIPVFLISLNLTRNSNFTKWPLKFFYADCFKSFDHIFCQNIETTKILFTQFNITQSSITGNTRFERVYNQYKTDINFPEIETFTKEGFVIIFGSSLPKDERLFLDIYKELKHPQIKWLIVPHEFARCTFMQKLNSNNFVLHSKIKNLNESHDILVIDSVGILKHIYKYTNLALIGGGFDKIGIHNIIEPAAYGIPIAFGPNHKNYEEAVQLINFGGAAIFRNSTELKEIIKNKLSQKTDFLLKENIKQFVKEKAINSSKISDAIQNQIKSNL